MTCASKLWQKSHKTSRGEGQGRIPARGSEKVRVQLSVRCERKEGCTLSAGNISAPLQTARSMDINRFLLFVDHSTLSPPEPPDYDRLGKVHPLMESLQS